MNTLSEMKVTIDSSMSGEGCKKIKAGKFIDFLKKTMIPFIPQFRSSAKSLFSSVSLFAGWCDWQRSWFWRLGRSDKKNCRKPPFLYSFR